MKISLFLGPGVITGRRRLGFFQSKKLEFSTSINEFTFSTCKLEDTLASGFFFCFLRTYLLTYVRVHVRGQSPMASSIKCLAILITYTLLYVKSKSRLFQNIEHLHFCYTQYYVIYRPPLEDSCRETGLKFQLQFGTRAETVEAERERERFFLLLSDIELTCLL